MERTKGELKILDGTILVIGDKGQTVATLFYVDMPTESEVGPKEAMANAEHILNCWNAFEEGGLVGGLVEACRKTKHLLNKVAEMNIQPFPCSAVQLNRDLITIIAKIEKADKK